MVKENSLMEEDYLSRSYQQEDHSPLDLVATAVLLNLVNTMSKKI